jgi:hypothetical protein
MPRSRPKPLVASGTLAASGGTTWLPQLGPHIGYTPGVLSPLVLAGIGLDMVIAPAIKRQHLRRGPAERRNRSRDRHRRPDARRLGQYLAAEHHLHQRRPVLQRPAPDFGPAHRSPGADRAGAGTWLRHRVLVDRRHLHQRRGRRRCPFPSRATGPKAHAAMAADRVTTTQARGGLRSPCMTGAAPGP